MVVPDGDRAEVERARDCYVGLGLGWVRSRCHIEKQHTATFSISTSPTHKQGGSTITCWTILVINYWERSVYKVNLREVHAVIDGVSGP